LIGLKITDISSISELTSLETLSLVQTNVKDISCISKLVNLQDVRLDYSPISDITPLYSLIKLDSLNLTRTHVKNLEVLTYLPSITDVWLPDLIKGGFSAIYKIKRVHSVDEVSAYVLTDGDEIETVSIGPLGIQTIDAKHVDKSITGDEFKTQIGNIKGLIDESTGLTSKPCRG
jgi:Leucine-rich repeat (LRR) protein